MIYLFIKHLHSIIRWALLILFLFSIIGTLIKLVRKKEFNKFDTDIAKYLLMVAHTQLVIGLILYFISPKVFFHADSFHNPILRFFTLEHIAGMLIAIGVLTIGYIAVKKISDLQKKFKRFLIYQFISLIIILLMIPWPWMRFATGWL